MTKGARLVAHRPSTKVAVASLLTLAAAAACAGNRRVSAPVALPRLEGSYRQSDRTFVVTYQGWWLDMTSQALRQLTAAADGGFTFGPAFMVSSPVLGELRFHLPPKGPPDRVTGTGPGGVRVNAVRVANQSRDVTFPSQGATIAGTITIPPRPGPHPGLVILQGSGALDRHFESISNGIYSSMGFEVLSFDKRGVGQSTGRFPGEVATVDSISTQAADAAAAAAFLMGQPEVDARRVGFDGNSQGGWVAPLAATRVAGLAFEILVAAPAVTTDQQDLCAGLSGGSAFVPSIPDPAIDAQVRAVPGCQPESSCYDPAPALRALHLPALWVYGELDRQVPVRVCVANLAGYHNPAWTIDVLPGGNHGTLQTGHGLDTEVTTSPGFAGHYLADVRAWLTRWGILASGGP